MREIAMFPLGGVLLPHMPLPLRIFEQRYLIMLGTLLDAEAAEFGVVLIERGAEAGGGDHRFTVGTLAQITQVAAREHDIVVSAVGGARIEVLEWLADDPYPRARVRILPELEWSDELSGLHAHAEQTVRRLVAQASEFAELPWDADVELSDDPVQSSWQLAGIAPLSEIDRLTLLRAHTVEELLVAVIRLCADAEPVLMAGAPDPSFDDALDDLLRDDSGAGDSDDDETDDDAGPR